MTSRLIRISFYPFVFCTLALGLFASPSTKQDPDAQIFQVTDKMRAETRYVIHSMENIHYSGKPFSSISPDIIIQSYTKDLDSNRLFFLNSDVESYVQRFSPTIEAYLQQGNIYPAFVIFSDYRAKANERISWVFDRLEQPFNFDLDETYTFNRKELSWPADKEAANALWDRRLKYELLNEILGEDDFNKEGFDHEAAYQKAKDSVIKRSKRLHKAINKIDASEVEEIFLSTITQMYDPHSSFFSAESLEDFSIALHNSLVGIGAVLADEEGYCTIKELFPGGPAALSQKLKVNDKIVAVGEGKTGPMVDVIGMKLRDTVNLIRGKKGTTVRLLISPADAVDTTIRKEISLTRDAIKLSANVVTAKLFEIPDNNEELIKIGVIEVPTFYGATSDNDDVRGTTNDVEELIYKLKDLGMEGLIVDFRRNGGGLLTEAVSLTGLFIPIGPVLQVQDSFGRVREHIDSNPRIAWTGPLIILTSRYSASAAEIVAGALKSYRRAILVGDTSTHGKGTVQVILEVDRPIFAPWKSSSKMGATKITIQKWYLPDGNSTQQRGVPSDIVIPSANEYLPISEADLPNALPWDAIHPLLWELMDTFSDYSAPVEDAFLSDLRNASLLRQETLEEFDFLKTNINRFREKQERKKISLNLEYRKKMLKEDESFKTQAQTWLKELAEQKYTFEDVALNGFENIKDSPSLHSLTKDKDEEDLPEFDINLREGIRIMKDWIVLQEDLQQQTKVAAHEEAERIEKAAGN